MATKKTPKLKALPGKNRDLDAFVNGGEDSKTTDVVEEEPNKRLTIDLPKSLHTRLKLHAVMEGTKMNALLRQWIEQELDERGA